MNRSKLILVTNDDGYQAQGLLALVSALRSLADIIVVAPEAGRSGSACSVTSSATVSLRHVSQEQGLTVVACSGTPVDCVKLALEQVCPRKPDLVASGINHGDNASISVHYSGTVGAVLEAAMKGIPAVAFSLRTRKAHCDFAPYLQATSLIASHALAQGLPQDVCLNVNYPETPRLAGIKVARLARGSWQAEWQTANHPRDERHYWLTGHFLNLEPEATDTDCWALDHAYAAVTPISLDLTAGDVLRSLA